MSRVSCLAPLIALLPLATAPPAKAHPHVFVDVTVDIRAGADETIEALSITWRFDPFETLYTLSAEGLVPAADGTLDEAGRRHLAASYANWHHGFDGFAELTAGGRRIDLGPPEDVTARLVDGRLEIAFTRAITPPVEIDGAEIAVYEATYYYAATVAETPTLSGAASACGARLIPFEPDGRIAAVQTSLFELGREETPSVEGVGRLFADRIVLSCG